MLFRFAHPLALVLLIVAGGWMLWRLRRAGWRWSARVPRLRYSDVRLMDGIKRGWRVRLAWLPDALRLIAWVLLVIALARPQAGQAREVIRGNGIDIVLALDISSSMNALDFTPDNRLQAAKQVMGEFIDGREFDRIGLVVFARSAFHQAPLTLDYRVLGQLLDSVRLVNEVVDANGQPLLLDGTAVGLGMLSSAAMLRDSIAPSRVIILLTDGENNAGIDPLTAADAMQALGIRVYTIGMGKLGEIPVPTDNGIVFVESELNEVALREIAARTGGLYFRAQDTDGLREIYAQIDTLERTRVERRVTVPWQDMASPLMVGAFILLVLERVLRRTVFQTIP